MKVNTNDLISAYDVDGTLIKVPGILDKTEDILAITDPYTGTVKLRVPHNPNIELMRKHKAQGYFVRVWSHGGSKWAETVVNKLGLNDIVDSIEAKPIKYVDDLPASEWMGSPIFVKED